MQSVKKMYGYLKLRKEAYGNLKLTQFNGLDT